MRPNDFDIVLYDAGAHTLIDSVASPLVALQDVDALGALTGYLTVFLAQQASLGLVANAEALQAFVLHAQRAGVIGVSFLDASFVGSVRNSVPSSPPAAPGTLWLSDAGEGVVNASTTGLGLNADRYELQQRVAGAWVTVGQGVLGEGLSFQVTGVSAGTQEFRVLPRIGFFAGFPGAVNSVEVAG